jgi:hypothetical protein
LPKELPGNKHLARYPKRPRDFSLKPFSLPPPFHINNFYFGLPFPRFFKRKKLGRGPVALSQQVTHFMTTMESKRYFPIVYPFSSRENTKN